MQVQQIANSQNFEGRIIKVGKFYGTDLTEFERAKKVLQDRVTFAPFDIYVKLNSSKRVVMSPTKDFNKKYFVTENGFQPATQTRYWEAYKKMRDDIALEIKKESFFQKLKYF